MRPCNRCPGQMVRIEYACPAELVLKCVACGHEVTLRQPAGVEVAA